MPFVTRSSSFFRLEGDFMTGGQEEDKSLDAGQLGGLLEQDRLIHFSDRRSMV